MPISESRAPKRAVQPSSAKGNEARRTRRWPLRVGVLAVGAIAVAAPMVAAEPASAPVQPPTTAAQAAVAVAEPVSSEGFSTIADAAHLTAVVTSQTAAEVEVTPPTTTTTTTTTTTPPTTTAPPAPAPAPAAEPSSGRCGGNLPPCYVMQRESGGSLTAKNPSSTASGKWQFLDSTWAGYGGYAHAWQAPESVQDAKAAQLWAGGAGCSHWSACG